MRSLGELNGPLRNALVPNIELKRDLLAVPIVRTDLRSVTLERAHTYMHRWGNWWGEHRLVGFAERLPS